MKPTMIVAIVLLTAIVLMTSFNMQLGNTADVVSVPAAMAGNVLYVCPAASSMWDSVAEAFHQQQIIQYIMIGFFFAIMILMFTWGWALYQNLLSDKFKRESFSKSWQFTKLVFWAGVLLLLVINTPNHYRRIHITGASNDTEYVLCESNSPGARAVRANAVTR